MDSHQADSPPGSSLRLTQAGPGPSGQLIRRFSDDMEEEGDKGPLSEGLVVKVSDDRRKEERIELLRSEWAMLLADADQLAQRVPDEEKHMLQSSRSLAKAWEKFQQALPTEQLDGFKDSLPSLSLLYRTVRQAETSWQQKRDNHKWGKIKKSFTRLSQFGEDHSQLLRIVPSNDKYTCLITGSITAIVRASVNHHDLAEALSESLEQLCDDVAHWKKQVLAHPNVPDMLRFVRELYVVIFEFLADIFKTWSTSSLKRLAISFDNNAVEKLFRSKQAKIERLTKQLDRAARLDTEHKINSLNESLKDEVVTKADLDRFRLQLGADVQRLLQEKAPWNRNLPAIDTPRLLSTGSTSQTVIRGIESNDNGFEEESISWQRSEYLAATPETFIRRQHEGLETLLQSASHLQVDRKVVSKLRQWVKGEGSTQFWIEGPSRVPRPSQNTLTAVALTAMARKADMTTIWHLITITDSAWNFNEAQALRKMMQSLLAQVVILLPEEVPASVTVSPLEIDHYFDDQADIASILDAFQQLVKLIPRPVICIIDGAEALENRSNREHTKELATVLEVLSQPFQADGNTSAEFKLWITTDGYVDAISSLVQRGLFESVAYELESDERMADDTVDLHYADVLERD